jgi:hypothetical protein
MFERLYDITEQTQVNFAGYISENARYDFSIIETDQFFGKSLVVCMQTGRSSLMCFDDLSNLDYLQSVFNIVRKEEAEELSNFLCSRLQIIPKREQY